MRTKIVLWGASSHAKVVADIVRLNDTHEIVGFLDDVNVSRHRANFCGATILGGLEQLDQLKEQGVAHLIMALGNNRARLRLAMQARSKGFTLVTAIHPRSVIGPCVKIGAGTVVMAGAVVNADSAIGENAVINTLAVVEHECVIHDGAHISAGVRLGGGVTVHEAATIEIGAIVGTRLTIGTDSVIGAGAVVLKDIPDRVLAHGVPARVVRALPDEQI
ncbi:MAG TPA: acetyltransferase [Pyrinomonadaceae bacterium]|nr:acetyltransferase [Pyrinomonadaceae bacterium]